MIAQLFAAAAAGSSSFYAFSTVAPLHALELTGSRAWSGLPGTCTVLGAAVGAALLSLAMARVGRRAGLAAGFALGAAGAVLAIAGVVRERFTFLLGGAALLGTAHAATSLARFAAADVATPARRGLVLGTVLWAGTIGALVGPTLPRAGASLEAIGIDPRAGALALVAAGYALATALAAALRPDPSALVVQPDTPADDAGAAAPDWRAPDVVLALVALVMGQIAMVAVMTVTPVHVHDAGHGVGRVGVVMAAHFVGMFGLAPLVGWVVPRAGAAAVIVAGVVVLIAGTACAAVLPRDALLPLWLFLLGLGWSCSYVAGSALVARDLAPAARLRLQGTVDAVVWMASAGASALAGPGLALLGYRGVAVAGAAVAVAPIAFIVARRVRAWNHARA